MLTTFFESIGKGLSERSVALIFSPAFLFWGGGALILAWQHGLQDTFSWLRSLSLPEQIAILLLALLLLTLSTALMGRLHFTFLRWLEGYWPWPLHRLSIELGRRYARKLQKRRNEWNKLMAKRESGEITPEERRRLAELDRFGHYTPADPEYCMPTALGNTLRALEIAVRNRYGLDAVAVWPYLWLLLPEGVQNELSSARQQLEALAELWFWGLLFLAWGYVWPWAVIISLVWMTVVYRFALSAACVFSDLMMAAFTLHRFSLYDKLNWSRPPVGVEEISHGERLSEYLWRGT